MLMQEIVYILVDLVSGSDYLQMAHTTDLCFGNGDFTIECWAYAEKHDSWNAIIGNWNNAEILLMDMHLKLLVEI